MGLGGTPATGGVPGVSTLVMGLGTPLQAGEIPGIATLAMGLEAPGNPLQGERGDTRGIYPGYGAGELAGGPEVSPCKRG